MCEGGPWRMGEQVGDQRTTSPNWFSPFPVLSGAQTQVRGLHRAHALLAEPCLWPWDIFKWKEIGGDRSSKTALPINTR